MSNQITKEKLKAIRQAMDAALAVIAREQGLEKLVTGKITYDTGGGFVAKVEGVLAGGLSREAQVYNDVRSFTPGLPELGTTLILNGRAGKVVGSNTTGSKILVEDLDTGKRYLYRVVDILRIASRKVAA